MDMDSFDIIKIDRGYLDSFVKWIWIVLILLKKDRDCLDSYIIDKC